MKSFPPLVALLAAISLTACPSRRPTPSPQEATRPPPVKVPPGCEGDLSGQYVHADRPEWVYAAVDDGGTLTVRPDGTANAAADGGVEIVLQRTPEGFLGTTRATAFAAQGVECEVRFPTELVGCPDGGLLVSTVENVAINESCVPAKVPRDARREEHLLLPAPPPPPGPSPD